MLLVLKIYVFFFVGVVDLFVLVLLGVIINIGVLVVFDCFKCLCCVLVRILLVFSRIFVEVMIWLLGMVIFMM